ncbi:MAG: S9 family peptidase [Pseudomonadota bacterium]
MTVGAHAQVPTPERPVTPPQSLVSPANPKAVSVPLTDLTASSGLASVAWSADGERIFVSTNISGRYNIWSVATDGSWPLRHTQSEEAQFGLAPSVDGSTIYYLQDEGGNEYTDVFALPVLGGAPANLTASPDRVESALLPGPADGLVALSTKLRDEGQSNIAVMDKDGAIRVLTNEKDPQFGWRPVAWIDDDTALIANRQRIDEQVGEVWRIGLDGAMTKLLGEPDVLYRAADEADGRLAVSANLSGQMRAGVFDWEEEVWSWPEETPWEQTAQAFIKGGRTLIVRTNEDARGTLSSFDVRSGKERVLDIPPGVLGVRGVEPLSPDGRELLVYRSAANSPGELSAYDVRRGTTRAVTRLSLASLSPDVLPTSEVVTYKSFDGTLISAVVTVPPNLERDSSHPAVVMPHGGPTAKTLDGFNKFATALASRGYFVIQPNFRGSTGYGAAFQAANVNDLGGGDLQDVIGAKTFLVESGYVDPGRVGIFGGSYGGFMALMAIGKAPEEFAAAVQLFGIINWRTMYRDQDPLLQAYQRSLIGTPDERPEVYDAVSPLTYINNATAPLLSLQGDNDIRVPRSQAEEVRDILQSKGNIAETIFYPDEGHGFRKRENETDALGRAIVWFDTHL